MHEAPMVRAGLIWCLSLNVNDVECRPYAKTN